MTTMTDRVARSTSRFSFEKVEENPPRENKQREERRERDERREALERALGDLREAAEHAGAPLSFALDLELEMIVVVIHEGSDKRVLRRIPAEEGLRLAAHLTAGRNVLMDRLL